MKTTANAVISSKVDDINRLMFENPDIFPKLNESYSDINLSNEGDRRYHLMHIFFNVFEQIVIDYNRNKFIEKSDWDSLICSLNEFIQKPYPRGHWAATKGQYIKEFQEFMDEQIEHSKILADKSSDVVRVQSEK